MISKSKNDIPNTKSISPTNQMKLLTTKKSGCSLRENGKNQMGLNILAPRNVKEKEMFVKNPASAFVGG